MQKLRILYAVTFPPYQILYGSEMRSRRFIEFLSLKADLDLITFTKSAQMTDVEFIRGNFKNHYYFQRSGKQLPQIRRLINCLPYQLTQYYCEDVQKKLHAVIEGGNYDFIFVNKLLPVFYFLSLPPKWRQRVIIDFDDIFSDLYRKQITRMVDSIKNSFSLKLNEERAIREFHRVFVCSEDAVSKFNKCYHDKIGIIPNVFPIQNHKELTTVPPHKNHLLFVGSLDYFPNLEGLQWFFKNIWPRAKVALPELKMMIIGKSLQTPQEILSRLGDPPDSIVELNVPDVTPYYERTYASVVPLLNGSGTRLKILESFALNRPVITTDKGMEGLNFEKDKEIFMFDDAPNFIKAYQTLTNDSIYIASIKSSIDKVKKYYSLNAFTQQMSQNWEIITNRR